MTRLLVSVRSAEEAEAAIAGGADIVDVKEPLRGSLGAADAATWRAVREAAADRAPLSAALGELREVSLLDDATPPRSLEGFQFAKLGLSGCGEEREWIARWRIALQRLPPDVAPIAVAYADWRTSQSPPPEQVLEVGVELGCAGLLIDTFDKRQGDLFAWRSPTQLATLIEAAGAARCFTALAGSLTMSSIPRALEIGADVIAVRGAVCRDERTASIDQQLVRNAARCVNRRETSEK
ncbi:MAG: (5-formylfuran-3-yl)methyl phosphate synthase [Pirellulaceae bacterium]